MSAADMLRARGKLGPYLPKAETVEPPTETDPPKPRKRAPRTG
jgi:hypothetical protein